MRNLLFALMLATSALANPPFPSVAKCFPLFREVFYSAHLRGHCDTNVIRLIEHIKKSGMDYDPKKARVLYVFRDGKVNLRGHGVRYPDWKDQMDWSFHVVFQYAGVIYDLDNSGKPKAVYKPTYLQEMFVPRPAPQRGLFGRLADFFGLRAREYPEDKEAILQTAVVRSIPADDYVRDYEKKVDGVLRDYSFYVSGAADPLYPKIPLRRFLVNP